MRTCFDARRDAWVLLKLFFFKFETALDAVTAVSPGKSGNEGALRQLSTALPLTLGILLRVTVHSG